MRGRHSFFSHRIRTTLISAINGVSSPLKMSNSVVSPATMGKPKDSPINSSDFLTRIFFRSRIDKPNHLVVINNNDAVRIAVDHVPKIFLSCEKGLHGLTTAQDFSLEMPVCIFQRFRPLFHLLLEIGPAERTDPFPISTWRSWKPQAAISPWDRTVSGYREVYRRAERALLLPPDRFQNDPSQERMVMFGSNLRTCSAAHTPSGPPGRFTSKNPTEKGRPSSNPFRTVCIASWAVAQRQISKGRESEDEPERLPRPGKNSFVQSEDRLFVIQSKNSEGI